jgi:spore maturation protein SpmA
VLNGIFIFLIVASVVAAAFNGSMQAVMQASLDQAKAAVTLAIGLIGVMALWLGLMRVVRDVGGLAAIGRALGPVMRRLFPDVPAEHPAMAAMIMNIGANMLGLGNAATPFGLKAMRELQTLNPNKDVATDSMALFLAINTSGVAVLPLGVIAVRAELGSLDAAGILVPSILATFCSTIVGVSVARLLQRRAGYRVERYLPGVAEGVQEETSEPTGEEIRGIGQAEEIASVRGQTSLLRLLLLGVVLVAILYGFGDMIRDAEGTVPFSDHMRQFGSYWLLPLLMTVIVMIGFSGRINVYQSVVEGAKEGFQIAVMIIPFLVAILVCIGMFRASGALDLLISGVQPATSLVGIPAEVLPMALVRPLSGSGALGVMIETITTYGPDSFIGYIVSVINGSTETTFYVLAVYFGSVQVRVTRHTLPACLAADLTGFLAAVGWCWVFFG